MQQLLIEQTASTLGVDFDPQTSTLAMSGESYPENALKFFTPVAAWLEEFLSSRTPGDKIQVDLDIIYFNSSTSKVLMNIFDMLEEAAKKRILVNIAWKHHAENEISQECGEEFAEELQYANFKIQAYEDRP
ncbi:DUF1987 domain-containing protein [Desulfatibacillum aliphaticivorans]|uniref:DUF1987 domain-containing protein n=1 Tax=Desulfatibacillum aliphaticivorans TaxID=218208 RepID=UPI0003F6F9DA|nr:DUF1987 domain-containing protein [Desulfatibacillum aliphaticivorans]